jgi:integrase/recombinase XerD
MAVGPVVLPTSGHAARDDLTTWWLSRYKISTQQTYATYLPRWTAWCTGCGLDPLAAVAPTSSGGCGRSPTPGCLGPRSPDTTTRWPASTGWPSTRTSSPPTPARASPGRRCSASCSTRRGPHRARVRRLSHRRPPAGPDPSRHRRPRRHAGTARQRDGRPDRRLPRHRPRLRHADLRGQGRQACPDARATTRFARGAGGHRRPHQRTAAARTRTGAGMDRRSVHRYVALTAQVAGITRTIGPHALRRTVGTVGLNQGIPLRDIQRLLRHPRPETTLASYDISGDALE